jgi:hypothetical protein
LEGVVWGFDREDCQAAKLDLSFAKSPLPNHVCKSHICRVTFTKSHFWQIWLARSSKRELREAQYRHARQSRYFNPSSLSADKDVNLTSLALPHRIPKKPQERY